MTPTGLQLRDESDTDEACYRAEWHAEPEMEIVVEATVQFGKLTGALKGKPESTSFWPWRDGVPVGLLVSDGRHQDGLALHPVKVTNYTDRSIIMDPSKGFHTYRLVIRGIDMSMAVNGELKVKGQGAFQRKAGTAERFIQFGSSSKTATGTAIWKSVRLGVRKPTATAAPLPVKVTMSEPWPIPHPTAIKPKASRPYLYNVGGGKLLMCVAEGPDAIHEPYGVMRSDDEGKTWSVVKELDLTPNAPVPMVRLKDGTVVGVSRWNWVQPDGSYQGKTVHWKPDLSALEMFDYRATMPEEYRTKIPLWVERQLLEQADGSLLMSAYSKTGPSTPEGLRAGKRFSHLLRSVDRGKTWDHYAMVGPGGEPTVADLGNGRMTAISRTGPFLPFTQVFSKDGGKSWSQPVLLEEGSVCPDLVLMNNGVLVCSYGRPANSLMFSIDGGKTWAVHHLVTDRTGFNYSGIVEIRPGRLLCVHDAGGLTAQTIDVERVVP